MHLALLGRTSGLVEVAAALTSLGHTVTLVPGTTIDDPGLAPQAVVTALDGHAPLSSHAHPQLGAAERPRGRPVRFRLGQRITVEDGWPLRLVDGAVALSALHADHTEVVIGVLGPGDHVLHHPSDTCSIEPIALSPVRAEVVAWEAVAVSESFAASLASRLLRAEAWAAAQAHPYLEQRLLGILNILSEQFGAPHGGGRLIALRLTHNHLAAIVGSTRPTITRVIAALSRSGHVSVVGSGTTRRLCVFSAGL